MLVRLIIQGWYANFGVQASTVFFNDAIDVEEMVSTEQVERYLRRAGFSHLESIPLDETEIQAAVDERKARKKGAVEAGVVEACAFFARK